MKIHYYSIIISLLTSCNFFAQNLTYGLPQNNPIEGLKNSSIAVGKINKDKFIDIFVSGENQNGEYITKIYINNPENPGTFIEDKKNLFEGKPNSKVTLIDLNNDKQLDLVVQAGGIVNIYFNKSYGKKFIKNEFENYSKGLLSFGDIDNDGDIDILTHSVFNKALHQSALFNLYINNGKGEFSSKKINLPPYTSIQQIEIADVNSDKNNDIILLASKDKSIFDKGERIYICINNGDGTFIEKENKIFRLVKDGAFKLFGLAWQGQWDIFVTGNYEFDQISTLYSNDGEGNYSTSPLFETGGVSNGEIAIVDFDNKYGDDFLLIGQYNTTVYLDSRNKSYRYIKISDIPFEKIIKHGTLVVEDLNGDYSLDILILGEDKNGTCFSKLYFYNAK